MSNDLEHWRYWDPAEMLDRKRAEDKKKQPNQAIKLAMERAKKELEAMFEKVEKE